MKKSDIIGLILLAFVIGCRFITPLADFYAERCYPYISAVLSLIASIVPFSLEEVVIIGLAAVLIFILVRAIRRKEGFLGWLAKTARLAMWIVVWFYMGWGNNYFRTPLIPRIGIPRVSYEEEAFSSFLEDYTEELNETSTASLSLDRKKLEADIKDFYGGGINDEKPITGNIIVDIFNSHVTTYCGGPKFGDMQKKGTTRITWATNQAGSSTNFRINL